MVRPANAYEADACSRGQFDGFFHGPGAYDRAKAIVSIHKNGGCVRSDNARYRARVHYVLANALGIHGKANHPVGIDTAQVSQN